MISVCFSGLLLCILCSVSANEEATKSTRADEKIKITENNFSTVCDDSDTARNECCSFAYERFKIKWSGGGFYLTEYLTTLKNWKCVEFAKECKTPIYDYTPFTRLVYNDFCDRNALFSQCGKKMRDIAKKYSFTAFTTEYGDNDGPQLSETIWKNLTSSLKPRKMELKDLNEPCVQVALFDRPEGGVGRFHEIVQPYISFCEFTWVGYDIDTAMQRGVSPWTSWSMRCRANLVICMVVAACLGGFVIIANSIVISVYMTSRKLQNSQSVFKICIASGDLLSGLLVIPNTIILQYLMHIHPRRMGDIIQSNVTENVDLVRREPGGRVRSFIPTSYLDFVGFFTTLSLTVSIYSLLVASFDRFWAIFRPLQYNKAKANRFAKIASISVWSFAVLFATIPYMANVLRYKLVLSMIVSAMGMEAIILMAVALAIPLITLCGVNCGTYQSVKRHSKMRRRLMNSKTTAEQESIEMRLSKVLGLMVGVFSICVFPLFFLILMSSFFGNLYFNIPEKLDPNASEIFNSVEHCAIYLFLSNSLWNCFIYSSRGVEFRKEVRSLRAVKASGDLLSTVFNSVRRLSAAPVMYYRRKSSASTVVTVTGSNPSQSTKIDSSYSADTNNAASVQSFHSKQTSNAETPKLYYPADTEVLKNLEALKKDDQEQKAMNDSTFGSFAIDAGTDRLYVSVMENIEEN